MTGLFALQILCVSVPGQIAASEVSDSVPAVLLVLLDQKPMVDEEGQSMGDRPLGNFRAVSRPEIVPDCGGLQGEIGSVEDFQNRVVVLPIHPRYTRAHVARTSRKNCLAVSLRVGCRITAGNMLHPTLQTFIVPWYSLVSNGYAFGSTPESAENAPDSLPNQEPDAWSPEVRPMENDSLTGFKTPDMKRGTDAVAAPAPSSLPGDLGASALVTAANHAHTAGKPCRGGSQHVVN